MDSRGRHLVKNIGILTISNFASKILVFLLVPLYTSVLTTEDVGIYDLAVSTVSLLYPILTMNIVDGVMRFAMDKAVSKNNIISIAIRYIIFSWIIGAILLCIVRQIGLLPLLNGYEILIYLYYIFYILYQFLLQFAKGLEKVADMGVAGVIGTVVMLGSNIFFLIVIKNGLYGFFIANILAQLCPAVYLFIRIKFCSYLSSLKINKTLHKDLLLYSTPLMATTLGWWVNSTADRYTVAAICGVTANGLLSVAYKIPQIINTLQSIFIQAWQISAIREYGEKDTAKFYGNTFNIINTLMSCACALLIICTRPLAHILFQKDFYTAWKYVPFLLISCVFNSASGILGPILSAKKDSRNMAKSAIYGAVTNIVLNIVLTLVIGIQGATIATVISSIIIYMVRRRAVGDEIVIEKYICALISWILLISQAIVEIYFSLWWIEIVIIGMIMFLNRATLLTILNMGRRLLHVRHAQR